MPLTVNFVAAQSPISPNIVILGDTSVGTDVLVVNRRIYVTDYAGQPVVPSGTTTDYIEFPLSSPTINLNILPRDMAYTITVVWLNASNVALYTLTQTFCFSIYTKQFLYYLVQGQSGLLVPPITSDSNYDFNLGILWTAIKGAINAIEIANDVSASQTCLNRAFQLMQNENISF